MREYQEAATAIPHGLEPVAPSPGLKGRILAAATGQPSARPRLLSRFGWSAAAAAVLLIVFLSVGGSEPARKELKGGPGAPAAAGHVLWKNRQVEVVVEGLPALPKGKVYQLWLLNEAPAPVPAATFTVDARGRLRGWDQMAVALQPKHAFALTVEPEGGSRSPTLPLYVVPGP